jgi:hypothetical protein
VLANKKNKTFNEARYDFLNSQSNTYRSVREIHDVLIQNGYESKSKDKMGDVLIRLNRLRKEHKLIFERRAS